MTESKKMYELRVKVHTGGYIPVRLPEAHVSTWISLTPKQEWVVGEALQRLADGAVQAVGHAHWVGNRSVLAAFIAGVVLGCATMYLFC